VTKEFTVTGTCPHCGHATQAKHDERAMREAYGNAPDIHMLCARCQTAFEQPMALACAEWDDYCQEIPLPADV
jgi:DNA-directed RNA polymerase subunit RPC12/RpoP